MTAVSRMSTSYSKMRAQVYNYATMKNLRLCDLLKRLKIKVKRRETSREKANCRYHHLLKTQIQATTREFEEEKRGPVVM